VLCCIGGVLEQHPLEIQGQLLGRLERGTREDAEVFYREEQERMLRCFTLRTNKLGRWRRIEWIRAAVLNLCSAATP